jgi:superoxide dismutase, Fe-Mn family
MKSNLTMIVSVAVVLMLHPLAYVADAAESPSGLAYGTNIVFQLPPLPYAEGDLAPDISAQTMHVHYGKHHQAYVDNLNKFLVGSPWVGLPLEKVVSESALAADKTVFNNAAQVWNHSFFWKSMKPAGGGKPSGPLLELIEKSFGSYEAFRTQFLAAALAQFGSGWVWLVKEGDNLAIVKTSNADTPIAHGQTPLLTCDVWEHAYYLDYQNRRKEFVEAFLNRLVNWDFAASQMK